MLSDEYRCSAQEAQGVRIGLHRPEVGLVTGALTTCCRYCGQDIRRAHRRSTWWRLAVKDVAPESFPRADDPGEGGE